MSTGSIFVVAALVVVALLDSLVNATTSSTPLTATPSSSSTQPVPTPTVTQTPASTSAGSAASVTSSPVHQFTSAGSAASVTSSPVASVAPTEAPRKKTCGSISFAMVMAWNESLYTDETYIRNYETDLQKWLGNGVFNDSSKYKDVKVSDLKFEKNEEKVKLTFKLCLVLKKDDAGYIEDMFKPGFKYNMMEVTNFEFKADGVELGEWKAKSGECDKCGSDGGAGPIGIERACKPQNDNSCNGLKTTYEDKDGCVKYCDSSAAAIMMSSFIIAMGVLLSYSFNI